MQTSSQGRLAQGLGSISTFDFRLYISLLSYYQTSLLSGAYLSCWASAITAVSNATKCVLMTKSHFHSFVEASAITQHLLHSISTFYLVLSSLVQLTFFWFPLTLVIGLPDLANKTTGHPVNFDLR